MKDSEPTRISSLRPNMILLWLGMGLAFHLLYFGFPLPLRLSTWLHVLFWPIYVLLGFARWVFYPFAVFAILCFAMMFVFTRRR